MRPASGRPRLVAFLCASLLGLVAGADPAHAGERRALSHVAVGVQLGGFYDLRDPGLELRGWARGLGLSVSLGRHSVEPSEPGMTEVFSEPGKQASAGLMLAFLNPGRDRAVPIKPYATGGSVHATQARARWERVTTGRGGGTIGEAGVEGQTGTWGYAGLGVEIGFKALPGLALGSEFLLTSVSGGVGVRFAVRYYA